MKEGTVSTRDGELFYRFGGQGEPLLLLHSLGVSSEAWRCVTEPLSSKFSLYAIDLMGHGDSDKPDKNYEIYDYAESIVEFMDVLGINQARVVGNSIGAMISVEMSASFPQRVVKQVLAGCPAWETAWQRMERLIFLSSQRYDAEGNLKPMTMDGLRLAYTHPTPELLEWVNNLQSKTGAWFKKGQIAVVNWDIMPKLSLVKCPTLVIFGDKDMLREQEHVLTRGIKGAQYALIEDAGHLPQIDAPEAFLKPVLEFL